MGRVGLGPVNYRFDRAEPGLGLEYMGPDWSGPRVGEPVANTADLDLDFDFFFDKITLNVILAVIFKFYIEIGP